MLSYHSLYLLWHIKCPNSLCFTPGAYTVTDCSIVFFVLIVLFFPKIERLSWAFVCLQMLSPIGKGSIFGSLTVKVDTIFSCCACTKPVHERCFFFFFYCVFADERCSIPVCFISALYCTRYDLVHILSTIDMILMVLVGRYPSITLMITFSNNRMSLSEGVRGLGYKHLINEERKTYGSVFPPSWQATLGNIKWAFPHGGQQRKG